MGGLRLTFGVLERAAPGPGAVLAERMWCTIPSGQVRPADPPGERFTVPVHGRPVVAEAWGEGPVIYLMHGWGGWRSQLNAFVAPLVAAGYRVVAIDAPSHGDSAPGGFGPGRGLLTDFVAALAAVIQVSGPGYAVIGHSVGGAVTAIAALDGVPAERLVLIAPASDPLANTAVFARALNFGERIRTRFLGRLERRVGRRMADFDIPARAAERQDLPPLLVVHDRLDKEVRHTDGEALAAVWPRAELMLTEGLGHRRILRDPGVVDAVVQYLAGARTAATGPEEAAASVG
ncbi:alpha/beta fold hydrolase [Micromonospora sp. NPDC003197]